MSHCSNIENQIMSTKLTTYAALENVPKATQQWSGPSLKELFVKFPQLEVLFCSTSFGALKSKHRSRFLWTRIYDSPMPSDKDHNVFVVVGKVKSSVDLQTMLENWVTLFNGKSGYDASGKIVSGIKLRADGLICDNKSEGLVNVTLAADPGAENVHAECTLRFVARCE